MARILIIDDESQMVNVLTTFLEREGHVVVSACNGKEGLNILAGSCFDIVITDIIMPERDGFEVLMSIKKMPTRPKIIAMSGGSPYLYKENLLDISEKMKADVVLSKPFQLSKLSDIIKELLLEAL
ncbi:MAG: response regulator [Oryzomonas sp.]|jgi:CheY-like chemotaxis protein